MVTVFVVMGHAGSHDDYMTWMTKGFYKLDDAVSYQELCKKEADRIVTEMTEYEDNHSGSNRFDPPSDPQAYWREMNKIKRSNTVDAYFEYEEPIDYTIEDLEVE